MTHDLNRYSRGAIAFHWIIAALVLANYVLVNIAHDLERSAKAVYMDPHKAIGITILVLTVLRIIWRLTHKRPDVAHGVKPWEAMLAKTAHSLFYILLIAIPLTGWMMVSAYGSSGVDWFGIFEIPALPVEESRDVGGQLHDIHEIIGKAMFVLIILHVLGALKHQFFDKLPVLAKMGLGRNV
ncbi:cytochrome b [Sphingorhabdus sp. Alg239-R122]|uniref:cytochrome b n=1 Tax=Sphingorhabdus sp. Alg239-R122 TaxID=2305989 RepID=UPI0013DADCAD|nr:cytochrome b [Sphingorhabdus sp. Alg239-R122]